MIPGTELPAPYTPHPERLVNFGDTWPASAFVRLQNPENSSAAREIYFTGDGCHHQARFDPDNPEQWIHQWQQLLFQTIANPLVGYFSYEFGFQFEPRRWIQLPIEPGQIMFRFFEASCWYEVNHSARTAKIVIAPDVDTHTAHRFSEFVHKHIDAPYVPISRTSEFSEDDIIASGELTPAEYYAAVKRILKDIQAGRYYELNFTQRFHTASRTDPAQLFANLLPRLNPRYAWYGQFEDERVVSVSPELFLHKTGTRLQTCPIKGSFKTQPSPMEQEKLAAEHIMVVDLARNDLGRISDKSWVQVAEQSAVKNFGEISHLESRVVGESSRSLADILAATYPAASITGTPKVMAVQAIAEYEKSMRGIYTGSAGVIWPDGDFQLNVAIRTLRAVRNTPDQWRYTLGAGGAIVAGSDPEKEYEECLTKAKPLLELL